MKKMFQITTFILIQAMLVVSMGDLSKRPLQSNNPCALSTHIQINISEFHNTFSSFYIQSGEIPTFMDKEKREKESKRKVAFEQKRKSFFFQIKSRLFMFGIVVGICFAFGFAGYVLSSFLPLGICIIVVLIIAWKMANPLGNLVVNIFNKLQDEAMMIKREIFEHKNVEDKLLTLQLHKKQLHFEILNNEIKLMSPNVDDDAILKRLHGLYKQLGEARQREQELMYLEETDDPFEIINGISPYITEIDTADKEQLHQLQAVFNSMSFPFTDASKFLAQALIRIKRAQDIDRRYADAEFVKLLEELKDMGVITHEQGKLLDTNVDLEEKTFPEGRKVMRQERLGEIIERLKKVTVPTQESIGKRNTFYRQILGQVSVKEGQELSNMIEQDLPGMFLLWKKGKPCAWQYHSRAAVTRPYFVIVISKMGVLTRLIIKPLKSRSLTSSHQISYERGNNLLCAIGAFSEWMKEGKDYVYIREASGIDMNDFAGVILKELPQEAQQKFFYALGIAMAEAHILGMGDRFHNLVIDLDKLQKHPMECLIERGNRAISNVDRETCLYPSYLKKDPFADLFEAKQVLITLGEFALCSDLIKDNVRHYLDGFIQGYRYHTKYFAQTSVSVSLQLKSLAGQWAGQVIERLQLSEEHLERIRNALSLAITRQSKPHDDFSPSLPEKDHMKKIFSQRTAMIEIAI